MLTYATYDDTNTQMNGVVYSKLAVVTVGGTANHLIKKYEDYNNGCGSWNSLCEWYDGDAVNNKTTDSLRYKLERYLLTSDSNTAQYTNNFLT